jgi:tripartite motif-containing protein 71
MEWKFGAISGKMVAGTGQAGNETNQLNWPTSVVIDKEKNNLIICDMNNERISQWSRQNDKNGQIIISNITCYALAIDNNGDLYIADWKKNEVRRWKINDSYGTLVAGGNGEGNHLDQLHFPSFIFVDEDHSVYVSDWFNNRAMKWMKGAKEGIIAAGGRKDWNDPSRLFCPWGLFVDHFGTICVAAQGSHRIMCWYNGSTEVNIIIGSDKNEYGRQANKLGSPKGLSLDRHGNLYVADSYNCRIQRFNINQI